jgi:hypothetical protein
MEFSGRGAARRGTVLTLLTLAGVIGTPAIAQAGLGAAASVQFQPTVVRVGDSGTAVLTLTNQNSAPDTGATNTICNIGDPCPSSPETLGISVVPSCQALAPGTSCVAGAEDPNVFALSATGTGVVGSACPNTIFDITRVTTDSPDVGRYLFVARAPNSPVTLAGTGTQCRVNFTYQVLKVPRDANPATPGFETIQYTFHNQKSPAVSPILSASGRGSAADQTILQALPTITTLASPDVTVGGTLTDQATVSGLVNPVAGSTVTFRLYPPSAGATCAGNPVHTSTKTLAISGSTGTATADSYTANEPGIYRWIATFNGDFNNAPVAGTCNEASETRSVTTPNAPPPPPPPPPGVNPPPPPPPPPAAGIAPEICTPPPGPAPAGGELCVRGTAAIRGRTGCAGSPFRVTVRGREITRVVFTLDGRVVRTLTRPNVGSTFVLPVDPRRMRTGVHRVLARTTFTRQSGTRARTLRVTFSRCARRASAPAFTG